MNTSQNSIWPNPDGELGKIKIGMPDGHEKSWPEGDTQLICNWTEVENFSINLFE